MCHVTIILLSLVSYSVCFNTSIENDFFKYLIERQKIIDEEESMSFGSNIILNKEEERVNRILMNYKKKELQTAFSTPQSFLPSKNFLRVSTAVSRSRVFRVIRKMPKGGVLHAHILAITSREFILGNITRRPNLYVCRKQDALELRFLEEAAIGRNKCGWELLEDARLRDESIDEEITKALTMCLDESYIDATDIEDTWKRFLGIFNFVKSLVTYRPVFEDFLYRVMKELYEDNVQFIEVRTSFSALYELNGYKHKDLQVLEIYTKVVDRFVKDYPNFMGIKWIYSPQRNTHQAKFDKYIKKFRYLKKMYPNVVIGFDLVGQEDKGKPLKEFAKKLLRLGKETQFFFHAGETNWNGQETDQNLFDAILLNSKRIGHGYGLIKHPKLMQLIKEKGIAIEINPISNQILKLVTDLRNHPASNFFAMNMPVVVSSDDPSFWGAQGLSYDFYETFIGIMSSTSDLRALKQLALNSIKYSCMNDSENQKVMDIWNKKWRIFLAEIIDDT